MGSAGLAIVNSLLDSEIGQNIPVHEQLFATDEKRRQYCRELLEDEEYAYAQYESPKVSVLVFLVDSRSHLSPYRKRTGVSVEH